MPQLPPKKPHQAGNKKTGVRRVIRQGSYRSNQFGSKPLIGIEELLSQSAGDWIGLAVQSGLFVVMNVAATTFNQNWAQFPL